MAKTAFVLAGGGTKGAFEAGAVAYLVKELGITPEVITATSAGSVCAVVLAQARSYEEFCVRADELHQDLLAMSHRDILFGRQSWLAAMEGTAISGLADLYITERTRPPRPGADGGTGSIVGGVPTNLFHRQHIAHLLRTILRLLPRLRRIRREIKRNPSSLLTLDPLARALRRGGPSGIKPIALDLIARPGLELRLAVTALGTGVLRYVTQDGVVTESDAVTPVPGAGAGPVDLVEAALASASVPLIFPPRPMADDIYVDGGVVNNVPVDAAARLGATRVLAILAVPLAQPRDQRDFTKVNALEVFLRSVGAISFAERQLANLRPPLPEGVEVTVIDPIIDVVGPFEVAQGLMLIDMDYGWLRAADVMGGLAPEEAREAEAATDALVIARVEAWYLEELLWRAEPGVTDVAEMRRALRAHKRSIRDALERRRALGAPCPPTAETWWRQHEAHAGPRPRWLGELLEEPCQTG